MDDNPYEAPSTTTAPPVDRVDTQRFHRRDYISAGCSFVVVFLLVLVLLGGMFGLTMPDRSRSLLMWAVGIFVWALALASLSAWQALYQARRRRLRRAGRMKTADKSAR